MSIVSAAGQHGPGDARQFVGDGDNHFVARSSLTQPVHPLPQSCGVVLDAKQHRAGTMDQHTTQIDIAAFTYAEQLLLASRGVLPWHDTQPSCEVTSPTKGCTVVNGRGCGAGDQRPKAGNLAQSPAALILVADALNLVRNRLDVDLRLLPLLPEPIQQPAQTRGQVLLGIFHNAGQILAQVSGLCWKGDATLQQKAADLVDQCRATLHHSI